MENQHMHIGFTIALIFGYVIFLFLLVNSFIYYEDIVKVIK